MGHETRQVLYSEGLGVPPDRRGYKDLQLRLCLPDPGEATCRGTACLRHAQLRRLHEVRQGEGRPWKARRGGPPGEDLGGGLSSLVHPLHDLEACAGRRGGRPGRRRDRKGAVSRVHPLHDLEACSGRRGGRSGRRRDRKGAVSRDEGHDRSHDAAQLRAGEGRGDGYAGPRDQRSPIEAQRRWTQEACPGRIRPQVQRPTTSSPIPLSLWTPDGP